MGYLNKKSKEKFLQQKISELDVNELYQEILRGKRSAIARGLTLIESTKAETHAQAIKLVALFSEPKQNTIRIGITGIPGVGKSTFIESLGMHLVSLGHKVGVLAIDPSSQKTKGSILGDKTRMERLSTNEHVFIRPSPSSGTLGGVAKTTKESITLLETAGYDIILIETVGVGQSETVVKHMVDFFLLLALPGAGDELQGIKRGIMEMADGIAINKAEGKLKDKAKLAAKQLKNALHLFPLPESGLTPFVMSCSALNEVGIDEVWSKIDNHLQQFKKGNYFDQNRVRQSSYWFQEAIKLELESKFQSQLDQLNFNPERDNPFVKAKQIVDEYFRNSKV